MAMSFDAPGSQDARNVTRIPLIWDEHAITKCYSAHRLPERHFAHLPMLFPGERLGRYAVVLLGLRNAFALKEVEGRGHHEESENRREDYSAQHDHSHAPAEL